MRFVGWIDEPFPLVECTGHVLVPLEPDEAGYRCVTCGWWGVDDSERYGVDVAHIATLDELSAL